MRPIPLAHDLAAVVLTAGASGDLIAMPGSRTVEAWAAAAIALAVINLRVAWVLRHPKEPRR